MKYKNIKTGLILEPKSDIMGERLKNSPEYEAIETIKEPVKKSAKPKTQTKPEE